MNIGILFKMLKFLKALQGKLTILLNRKWIFCLKLVILLK